MSVSNRVVKEFVNGKQNAIEKVYLEYKNLMYFVIANYVSNQDDCDDVLSDAFLKAIEHKSEITSPDKLKSFLCSIAKNEAINFSKKNNASFVSDAIDELYGEEVHRTGRRRTGRYSGTVFRRERTERSDNGQRQRHENPKPT